MRPSELATLLRERVVLLDGGLGSMLMDLVPRPGFTAPVAAAA